MVQDGAGGGGAVTDAAVAEGTDEHFADGGDDHLPKGLVGSVVLVEDGGDDVMGVAKVGDLGPRRDILNGRLGAQVDRSNEGRGRECSVHGGRDGELHQSGCDVAQVRLDGCDVRVQF